VAGRYAQTSAQLFHQLVEVGYDAADRDRMLQAYLLAAQLVSGSYRPSGKTFLAHLVGTASILASRRTSGTLIAAGLLHSVYRHGDFGGWTDRISRRKRRIVRRALGFEVEIIVHRYAVTSWDRWTLPALRHALDRLDTVGRDVVLIRLANELDDWLHCEVAHCANASGRIKGARRDEPHLMALARILGHPGLGEELRDAVAENRAAAVPEGVTRSRRGVYRHVPGLARKRASVALGRRILDSLSRPAPTEPPRIDR
jgi:Domain of unknown function (DUF6817)